MRTLAAVALSLSACFVDGDPVGPDWKPCPDVAVYLSVDTVAPADSAIVTDSIDHEPECDDV